MLVRSGCWTALLVVELTSGRGPSLHRLNDAIWVAFVAQFALEVIAAPQKRLYLRKHWVTAIPLLLPAMRLLRLASDADSKRVDEPRERSPRSTDFRHSHHAEVSD